MSWKNLEDPENMYEAKRLLTLDANVFVAALKRDEPHSDERVNILNKVPTKFLLCEPSIVYQEVCGTVARKIDLEAAKHAEQSLSKLIHPLLLITCDKLFYPLYVQGDFKFGKSWWCRAIWYYPRMDPVMIPLWYRGRDLGIEGI